MRPEESTELEDCKSQLNSWTDSLEELSDIQEAFALDRKGHLTGKTILDIGTDCIKSLFIALKFCPEEVIGIDESLPEVAANILLKSKLLIETKLRFYNCNFFDESGFERVLREERITDFDIILLSKTLHHLRTGECIRVEQDGKHDCKKDTTEKDCIYGFDVEKVFNRLLMTGKRVVVYEYFYPVSEDDDKIRGQGGYLTAGEWKRILSYLSEKHRVIRPQRYPNVSPLKTKR